MIVRTEPDGVLLITQPDHAHLAGRIMAHCVPLAAHPRRSAIMRAIAEHDNGWIEIDAAPTVNLEHRTVVDFITAPLAVRHGVWPRAVARLADEPWAAALVAQHALVAYDRFRGDADWTTFFTTMEAARGSMLDAGGLGLDDLLADYPFVRVGDLLSLAFCTGGVTAQRFGDWTIQLSGSRVMVTPDLFGGQTIPFDIDARHVGIDALRSDQALRDALSAATPTTLRGDVAATA